MQEYTANCVVLDSAAILAPPAAATSASVLPLCCGTLFVTHVAYSYILEIIVHGDPVHDQTGIGLLLY